MYSFTSDPEDVPEKMAYHVESFKKKLNLEKRLSHIVSLLSAKEVKLLGSVEQIDAFRKDLAKFDLLLQEVTDALIVCQKVESGDYQAGPEYKEELEKTQEPKTNDTAVENAQLNASLTGLKNFTESLKEFKK